MVVCCTGEVGPFARPWREAVDIGPEYPSDLGLRVRTEAGGKVRFRFPSAYLEINGLRWKYHRGEVGHSHSIASLRGAKVRLAFPPVTLIEKRRTVPLSIKELHVVDMCTWHT
jgi:hypothetical protein